MSELFEGISIDVDRDALRVAVQRLAEAEPDLLPQIDSLFLADGAPYEPGAFVHYLFRVTTGPAGEAGHELLGLVPRDKYERATALAACERRKACHLNPPSITPDMIEAGGRAARGVLLDDFDPGEVFSEMIAEAVYRAMEKQAAGK